MNRSDIKLFYSVMKNIRSKQMNREMIGYSVVENLSSITLPDIILFAEATYDKNIVCYKETGSVPPFFITRLIMPSLKKILFAGENLPTRYLIEWMKAFPEKQFYNAYGPTEATGITTFHHIKNIPQNPMERIPIGRACGNTEVFLLKEDDSIAGIGEVGELCIRGSGLSRGYWNDMARTKEAFIPNPLNPTPEDRIYRTGDLALLNKDGNYEFLGRKDTQVKCMGYRIDVTEIENALISSMHIKDAAVVLRRSEEYDVIQLVALVVTGSNSSQNDLREKLNNSIPAYMMPHQFLSVGHIPRTSRGKIDRKAISKSLSQL